MIGYLFNVNIGKKLKILVHYVKAIRELQIMLNNGQKSLQKNIISALEVR